MRALVFGVAVALAFQMRARSAAAEVVDGGAAVSVVALVLETAATPGAWVVAAAAVPVASTVAAAAVPVASTVAILRHRLWDVDLFLRRSVVYGVLTAFVVVGYALLVNLLSAVFDGGPGARWMARGDR